MSIVIYSRNHNQAYDRLRNLIQKLDVATVGINSMENLTKEQLNLNKGSIIAVLIAADQNDLRNILSFHPQLDGIRIILVLPNSDKEEIALGAKLYPRYISYMDSDFNDVFAVLKKMSKQI